MITAITTEDGETFELFFEQENGSIGVEISREDLENFIERERIALELIGAK